MSDETPEQPTTEDGTTARRASATSRARRIGGRPVRTGAPGTAAPEGVRLDKPAAAETPETVETTEAPDVTDTWTAPPEAAAEPTPAAGAPAERRALLPWLPAALLTVVALVFGVLVAVFAATGHSGKAASSTTVSSQGQTLRERVLAAAKNCLAQANSYDYRTMQASEVEALKCATGSYARDLRTTFEKSLKVDAPKVHAIQSVQVDVAGIEGVSSDGRTWTVLLFGQVTINKTGQSGSRVDPVAAKATLQQVGGRWLIAKLDRA